MASQTQLPPPPNQSRAVDGDGDFTPTQQQWQFTLQNQLPLVTVDTTDGNVVIAAPPAGLNASTGQTAQNREITYVKSSADGNTVTVNGVEGGPYVLAAQYDFVKIKSDGTSWWKTG